MMAMRAPPSTGIRASSAMRSRMPRPWRRPADDDLPPGTFGAEPMHVRMSARSTSRHARHEPQGRSAGSRPCTGGRRQGRWRAWSCRPPRGRRGAGRAASGPGSWPGPRAARPRAPGSGHRPWRGSGGLGLGGGIVGRRGLAGRPALRGRLRGAASAAPVASAADSSVEAALRVVRRFGAASAGLASASVVAVVLRVVRRFGAAVAASVSAAAVSTGASPVSSGVVVVALRVVRRFGARPARPR